MSIMPFAVELEYKVVCGECGETKSAGRFMQWQWSPIPNPCLPNDWKTVGGVPYCNKHRIIIKTDASIEKEIT